MVLTEGCVLNKSCDAISVNSPSSSELELHTVNSGPCNKGSFVLRT